MNKISVGDAAVRMFYRGVTIDERTKEYVEKRLEKAKKILRNILEIEVEIDMDKKGKFRVEIMLKTPHSLYRAEDVSESIEGSTDIACGELYRQVVNYKDRIRDLKERGGRSLKKKMVLDENARFKK